MEDEQNYSLEEKAEIKRFKDSLSKTIKKAIDNKLEFEYLKLTSESNDIPFDERIINFSLDKYNCLMKEKKGVYTSKYVSLWETSFKIFIEKTNKDEEFNYLE